MRSRALELLPMAGCWPQAALTTPCICGRSPAARSEVPSRGMRRDVVALHFSPAGRLLAAASSDAPVYLWDVYSLKKPQPARTSLDLEDRQKLWLTLAETDAAKAFQAVCELIGRPDEAVALFADEWKRLPRTTAQQMLKWVEDLSSAQFAVRKKRHGGARAFKGWS